MNRTTFFTSLLAAGTLAVSSLAAGVSVRHELGTLELQTPAKRVVALEYSFIDTLLALGVKPVGASLGQEGGDRGAPPYLAGKTQGVAAVGSRAQPSLEKIAASKPDLIVADAFVQSSVLPQLARMAPTAAFQSRRGSLDDLNAQTLALGQLLGREAAARRLLAEQARPARSPASRPSRRPRSAAPSRRCRAAPGACGIRPAATSRRSRCRCRTGRRRPSRRSP